VSRLTVDVVIPALNEAQSIGEVIRQLPPGRVRRVVVVDNGSTDGTADVARASGAVAISEPRRGYGRACWTGIEFVRQDPPDILAFVDADLSDYPAELSLLLEPIEAGRADLVIGTRLGGNLEKGALTPAQHFGNLLAPALIRLLYGHRYGDLGPFRAIRFEGLLSLGMQDRGFGWTVEMQIRALQRGLRPLDVPVSYRRRVGKSKISGTLSGSFHAGRVILWTIFRCLLDPPPREFG
jgi:glycosyltransferase involved in cell wall biosynthesis